MTPPIAAPIDLAASVVRAVVLYSLAEAQAGHATTIRVGMAENGFTVEDDGRGHAVDRTVAELPYLRFIYTHLAYPFDSMSAGLSRSSSEFGFRQWLEQIRESDPSVMLFFNGYAVR
jgi:hypothetical protein